MGAGLGLSGRTSGTVAAKCEHRASIALTTVWVQRVVAAGGRLCFGVQVEEFHQIETNFQVTPFPLPATSARGLGSPPTPHSLHRQKEMCTRHGCIVQRARLQRAAGKVATCSGQGCNVQQARLVPRIVHHAVTQVKHFLADARTYLVKMLRIVNIKESYMVRSLPRLATAAAMRRRMSEHSACAVALPSLPCSVGVLRRRAPTRCR